jgi:hypothetical protein
VEEKQGATVAVPAAASAPVVAAPIAKLI